MRNEYRAYLQQCKEQESLYHQIALSLGLPDSVLYLLYTIAEQGDRKNPGRPYSEWSISKQTGHSAVEWLKKRDLVTLEPDPQDRRGKTISRPRWRPSCRRRSGPFCGSRRSSGRR